MPALNVGGHLSLGQNPADAVAEAKTTGYDSMQIFASSPGQWRPPVIDEEALGIFQRARQEHGVNPLFIHAIYLINLGSANSVFVRRSRASLDGTLRAGRVMGAAGVITHIGSHGGRGFGQVAGQIANELAGILMRTEDTIDLILENSAGAGGIVGADLSELGELIDRAGRPERLKVALDTAHLCGAGWDFREAGTAERLIGAVERHIGRERLSVIHANDSLQPPGSRRDRHANVGEGYIGLEGFRRLLSQPMLTSVPWILETPALERRVEDLATLRALIPEITPNPPSAVSH